jgi:hypothetical protein
MKQKQIYIKSIKIWMDHDDQVDQDYDYRWWWKWWYM